MNIVSLFSGAGGLDLGFKKAGFNIVYANEYDKDIWETYRKNSPETFLDTRSITDINENEIPNCDGIIGGPPCQSWSAAGSLRGINDSRGKLFFDFIRIISAKKPKFFLAENVPGIKTERHAEALEKIKNMFIKCGYKLYIETLNAADYSIAQDRQRVFFLGIRTDINETYFFPNKNYKKLTLKDIIFDLSQTSIPCLDKGHKNPKSDNIIANHEYLTGGFSTIYMSRNRVRSWDEKSFTIQAGGRHAPIHPSAPKMEKVGKDRMIFKPGYENLYRRLSVRECARIQGFPDDFYFYYKNILHGYKMIGNAVPVNLAFSLATSIKNILDTTEIKFKKVS